MLKKYLCPILAFLAIQEAYAQSKKVTLEDVWIKHSFYAQRTQGISSINDGEYYTVLVDADEFPAIEKFSYKSGKSKGFIISSKLIKEQTGKSVLFDSYQFRPDENKVLLAVETESIYRYSSKSYYYVYDLKANTLDSIKVNGKQQLADFSPTRNQVAFVYKNQMHVQDFDKPNNELISFGMGKNDAFIAGAVDWVYEEEFSFDKGFCWSPDGNYIAYYQFDEREVPLFSMDVYGKELYPSEYEFKYPKAGESNSIVTIHLFDINDQEDIEVKLNEDYEYIPRILWSDEKYLVIITMNRLQNQITLWKVEAKSGESILLYRENAPAYIEIDDDIRFLKDGSFIWTSEKDGHNHLYHISEKGIIRKQLTKGDWDVMKFYGINEKTNILYYQSAEESPLERYLYSISLSGDKKKKLSKQKGWNEAEFSNGLQYYINTYSSKDIPTLQTLHSSDGKQIRVINDNAVLKERLYSYDLAGKEFFSFKNEEDIELNGWMVKPRDFDSGKTYPVLMFVYGGPGSQTVKNRYDDFNYFWYQILADYGYITVSVDNRGTGGRGRDFRTATYRQLGKLETKDQISAAKYLTTLPYVNKQRIGIWGWSYGGYMSSLCLFNGVDIFKMAIAVAPVTSWRFYDNIYTERYMQTPRDNAKRYDDSSPLSHVNKMKGSYLLIHGSADDNVHLQNTMYMVNALVAANKQFDLFIYPDKNHAIGGGNTRYHLYKKMTNFILENL